MDAIKKGGLFSVDVDIIPTQIGQASHVWLPAATSGEMNLTSMNGERRMRLTERYMDPPGRAMPDCLIAARIANHMERVFREQGKTDVADRFKGFDWKTEEDAFMDGYHKHEKGGEFVTYARLRAMGTNGFQEPAVGIEGGPVGGGSSPGGTTTGQQPGMVVQGPAIEARAARSRCSRPGPSAAAARRPAAGTERIIGTKRLYADGKFNTKDGKAVFMETKWRGLQAAGKEEESKKFPFLINNGRTNHVWQSAYLDQQNEFVMDRYPFPFIEMNPQDMAALNLKRRRPRRGVQRQRLDAGDGLPDRAGEAEADLHAVRLPDGRAGQRRLARGERVHHPELQADLGQHPQARGRARGGEGPFVQVEGVLRRLSVPPDLAGRLRPPGLF